MPKELKNFIAGEWMSSDKTFVKTSPFDGAEVAVVHEATEAMVDQAVMMGHEVSRSSVCDLGRHADEAALGYN